MNEQNRNSILVGDINLSYYRKGNGKKALILLHGNSEDATIFAPYLETVSEDFKAYAIDSRGHGHSESGDGEYTIKTLAIDIMRFINVKPFATVTVVGYSDGANVAMYLAKLAPELIDRMVLISGNLFAKSLTKPFFNSIKFIYKLTGPFKKLNKKSKGFVTRLELMLNNIGVYPEDLNKFNFPTLVIDAEKDLIKNEHTAMIAREIPDSRHVTIKDTNHSTIIKSQTLFDAINNFIN